jgi:hypothetical protein
MKIISVSREVFFYVKTDNGYYKRDADGDWYLEDYYDDYTQTEYITDDEHELIKLLEEAYKNYVERAFNGSY